MMDKRWSIPLLVLGLLLPWSLSSAQQLLNQAPERDYDRVMESGYLKVGLYENFPPYSWERDGEPAGVDVEIGRRIAEALGLEFRHHWITPGESLEDDLRNNIGMGHYLRRTQLADVMLRVPYDKRYAYRQDSVGELINEMSVLFGPYQQERWRLAHDREALEEVPTIAVFQYHLIGVEIDSLPATYLTSFMQGRLRDNVRHYRGMSEAVGAMSRAEVAAVMGMQGELEYQLRRLDDGAFALADTGFPGVSRQAWDIGMAVRSTHRQLGYAIEAVVDEMVRSGEMAALFRDYGLSHELPDYYQQILEDGEE